MKKVCGILIILLLLSGCAVKNSNAPVFNNDLGNLNSSPETTGELSSQPPEQKGSMTEETKLFTSLFNKEYEGAAITKVRWQLVDDGSNNSTYIIEGIKNGNKYILKLLNWNSSAQKIEDIMILGRVERPLKENELQDGKPLEQSLELTKYISVQQILDTALREYDSTVQEWKLVWVDGREVIQVILWDKDFVQKILVMDAISGEVLRKMP